MGNIAKRREPMWKDPILGLQSLLWRQDIFFSVAVFELLVAGIWDLVLSQESNSLD